MREVPRLAETGGGESKRACGVDTGPVKSGDRRGAFDDRLRRRMARPPSTATAIPEGPQIYNPIGDGPHAQGPQRITARELSSRAARQSGAKLFSQFCRCA